MTRFNPNDWNACLYFSSVSTSNIFEEAVKILCRKEIAIDLFFEKNDAKTYAFIEICLKR